MFLVLIGVAELALLGLLGWWAGPGAPLPRVVLFLGAFLAYGGAAAVRARSPDAVRPAVVWGFAVAFRVLFLPLAPELSDDVYRYLWDGHVQLQGINPYRYPPADAALAEIRTPWHGEINNPGVATIYPPLAQLAFLLIAAAGGGILRAKLLWLTCDLLTGWVLFRVARATGRDGGLVLLLYLWSPLLVVETAWSGHLEPLGLLGLSLALLAGSRATGAGVATAGAALTKFAPAAALPALARRLGWRFVGAFTACVLLLYAPYLSAGSELWSGLTTYARDWRFMAGPFAVVDAALPGRWPPRLAVGALVVGIVGWTTARRFDPERALFWILGAGLLLTPTLHPWYVLWILPFAALRTSVPWILLSGLAFLGYWGLEAFRETGSWPQPLWLRIVLWSPPLALLVRDALWGAGTDRARDPVPETGEAQGEPASAEEGDER